MKKHLLSLLLLAGLHSNIKSQTLPTSLSTKALIDTNLPTNNTKSITATTLRTTLKAIVDYSDTKAPINNPTFTGITTFSKDAQVIGSTTSSGGILLKNPSVSYTAIEMGVGSGANGSWIQARTPTTNTSQYLTLNPTGGSVGVGITNGAKTLSVNGSIGFGGLAAKDLQTELDKKVDIIAGKGLSTNDFTNSYKAKSDSLPYKFSKKVNIIAGKGLSTNDFTNSYKAKSDSLPYRFSLKVDKISGKGLSTNDFTNTYKATLDGINTSLDLIGQADNGNNNSKITLTNQGFGADSRLTFTQSNYLTGAGWQFGEDILNVHGSYFGFAGNSNPQANIDLGTSGTLKIGNLAGAGKVLTSDASGNATWSTSPLDVKQNTLTGTGFVKSTGGTISYDNSTYLTSIPAQTFASLTGKPTTISGYGITDAYSSSNPSGYITSSALSTYATQANLVLKANIASPTFTTGAVITGTASNTVQGGPFLYLNGGSGTSFSTIQQGVGTLDVYGFNGSGWVNNLSVNNAIGNVGIGTATPTSKLHVVGGSIITGGWIKNTIFEANFPTILFKSSINGKHGGIGYDGTSNMNFWVNGSSEDVVGTGTNALSIQSSTGNVGIGTSSPILPLSISSDNNDIGQVIITGKTNTNKSLFLGYNTTNNYGVIQSVFQGIGYSNLILNPSGGNVGIGTSTPAGKLDVVSTTTPSYPFPRMTTTQVNAISGMTAGAWVFDTTTNHPKYYNGTAWVQL